MRKIYHLEVKKSWLSKGNELNQDYQGKKIMNVKVIDAVYVIGH